MSFLVQCPEEKKGRIRQKRRIRQKPSIWPDLAGFFTLVSTPPYPPPTPRWDRKNPRDKKCTFCWVFNNSPSRDKTWDKFRDRIGTKVGTNLGQKSGTEMTPRSGTELGQIWGSQRGSQRGSCGGSFYTPSGMGGIPPRPPHNPSPTPGGVGVGGGNSGI